MPQNNFIRNVERGNIGERYVYKHIEKLVNTDLILNYRNRADEHVEGGDATAYFLSLGKEIDDFLPDYVDAPELSDCKAYEVTAQVYGGLEVKTDWGLLFRSFDKEDPSGTLPFVFWSDETRKHPGWVPRTFFPQKYFTEGEKISSVQPMAIVFMLAAYRNAYACVVFENVKALIDRVCSLANTAGFNIDDLPYGDEALNWQPEGIILQGNTWYISLSQLEDLATVTMIGKKPRIRPDIIFGEYRCTSAIQEKRYKHLKSLARGRKRIPVDREFVDAFTPSDRMKVFADINDNLSIIEHIDPERFPVLSHYSTQIVSRHLKGLMLNMLSRPYPIWPESNPTYFAVSNNYLEEWCKAQGIGGSSKSIQGSLMFLRIIGLVKAFRPGTNYHDPITDNLKKRIKHGNASRSITLRTVPLYADDVLQHAEERAKLFFESHINISKLVKTDVSDVLGQEEANRFYQSGFTKSQIEDHVDTVMFRVFLEEVQKNGYALYEPSLQKAQQIIDSEAAFAFIDPFSVHTEEERMELQRQREYYNAFIKFGERKTAKATKKGLEYHQISKNDREKYNIPPEVRCWIFTKT